jgi:hypothetical protein
MSEPIKLFLDEDSQRTDLIQALRARHIDVDTASEAGLLGQPDEELLRYATVHDRALFTFNRGDFFHLHTEWLRNDQHHAGIIVSDQLGTGVVIRRLLRLIDAKAADDLKDQFEFLSSWR